MKLVNKCLAISNDLQKCLNILAQVLRAQMSNTRDRVNDPVTIEMLEMARSLVDISAAMEVTPHIKAKLQFLAPSINGGKWVTQRQLRYGLPDVQGDVQLQV